MSMCVHIPAAPATVPAPLHPLVAFRRMCAEMLAGSQVSR